MKGKKKEILIFEGDEGIAYLTKEALEKANFGVEVASFAKEGLALLKEKSFDAFLIDYKLPDMKGMEIFEEIKKIEKEAVCIMVTDSGTEEIAVRAIKAGMYDYIVKEVNAAHLFVLPHVIESTLAKQKGKLENERIYRELEEKNRSLEEINKRLKKHLEELKDAEETSTGHASDILNLKKEINELLSERGKGPKYKL